MHLHNDIEVWVRSPTFNFLSVSSHGRLRIDPYEITMPKGGIKKIEPKPTYGCLNKKMKRYVFVNTKRGISRKVHQLVCEAFHGSKPFEDAVVMHIDDDSTNNHKDNLKWGTQKENLNTEKFLAWCKSRTGENHPFYRNNIG